MQTCDYKTKPTLDSSVQQNDECSGLVECSTMKKQTEYFLFLLTSSPQQLVNEFGSLKWDFNQD